MNTEPVERLDPHPDSPWWGEHRSRYHFAASMLTSGSVLDIACGTGFGTKILAGSGASTIIGMDVEMEPATDSWDERIAWCFGDGTRLPIRSGSIGFITSFETIEHVEDDKSFISELRRVLSDDGILVLSTPNGNVSLKQHGRPANPFHVREYEPEQLRSLLGDHFSSVTLMGQRTKSCYKVSPFWEGSKAPRDDLATKARMVSWKLQNRLPLRVKDGLSRALHKRSFFPGEFDFDFSIEHVPTGHVLVAICGAR